MSLFRGGSEQQATFQTLRQKLCEALILTLSEGVDDCVVYYDALIMGLDVVLM